MFVCLFVFCVAAWVNLHMGTSLIYLPTAADSIRSRVPVVIMFPSLLLFSLWPLYTSFVQKLFNQPQFFFKRNCSICRYIFNVHMGGGEFRLFLHSYLRSPRIYSFLKPDTKVFCLHLQQEMRPPASTL